MLGGAMTDEVRVTVDCAYAGCQRGAITRVLTKTGWANMCQQHYEAWHTSDAKQYTAGLGLKTRQDLIQFCREKRDQIGRGQMHGEFKKQFEAKPPVRVQMLNRVPGEDDEPIAAEAA